MSFLSLPSLVMDNNDALFLLCKGFMIDLEDESLEIGYGKKDKGV